MAVSFKTLSKTSHWILKNPSTFTERDKNGKVKSITPIRYVEGIPTIIQEEQDAKYKGREKSTIYIQNGVLTVSEDDIYLIEFLRKTDQNEINGGRVFKEIEVEKEELYEMESYYEMDDARQAIRNGDENEVRAMAMWFMTEGAVKMDLAKIKMALIKRVEEDSKVVKKDKVSFAKQINDFVKEKSSDEKLLVTLASQHNIIGIKDGRRVVWGGTDEVIFLSPSQGDIWRNMAVWLKNDEEGREYAKLIADKIKAIKKEKK